MRKRLDILDNTQDYYSAKNHIYGLAHNVCATGQERRILLDTLHNIEEDSIRHGLSGAEIIRNLLYPIIDGLAYGNWPWIKNGVNTLQETQ